MDLLQSQAQADRELFGSIAVKILNSSTLKKLYVVWNLYLLSMLVKQLPGTKISISSQDWQGEGRVVDREDNKSKK